jgi:hypothetical protein
MGAGYANRIYRVRKDSDFWWTDIYPLRFKCRVLCNTVNGHVMYATVVWKACQLRLKMQRDLVASALPPWSPPFPLTVTLASALPPYHD